MANNTIPLASKKMVRCVFENVNSVIKEPYCKIVKAMVGCVDELKMNLEEQTGGCSLVALALYLNMNIMKFDDGFDKAKT